MIVHLFEWKWKDIANECEEYLGPKGFCAVQVSPPMEHIQGMDIIYWVEWHISWQKYQEISWFCHNWPKLSHYVQDQAWATLRNSFLDVNSIEFSCINEFLRDVLESWYPNVLKSLSPNSWCHFPVRRFKYQEMCHSNWVIYI